MNCPKCGSDDVIRVDPCSVENAVLACDFGYYFLESEAFK